ncbi:MAG: FN3 associated domain-containing protein [Roseburia sp.]
MRETLSRLKTKKRIQKYTAAVAVGVVAIALLVGVGVRGQSETINEVNFAVDDQGNYQVETAAQLQALGNATEAETQNRTFLLTKDITVESVSAASTGTFAGTLDGNGHMITYGDVTISSETTSGTETVINEGILFGSLTGTGTVKNLFLKVGDVNYVHENAVAATVSGGEVSLKPYTEPWLDLDATGDERTALETTIKNMLLTARYDSVTDTTPTSGKIVFTDPGETQEFYIKIQAEDVGVQKADVITTQNGKEVHFGVVCGENKGTIQDVKVRAGQIKATTNDDSYKKTETYSSTETITLTQWYKVDVTGDSGTDTQVVKPVQVHDSYCYLYAKDSSTGAYYPLYQKKGDGTFDLEKPLYNKTANNTKFDLCNPTDEGTSAHVFPAGSTCDITATDGNATIPLTWMHLSSRYYLYANSGADLTKPLYEMTNGAFDVAKPLYQKVYYQNGWCYYTDGTYDMEHAVLYPACGNLSGGVSVTQYGGPGTYYYVYGQDSSGKYVELYKRNESGVLVADVPLYNKTSDGLQFDLSSPIISDGGLEGLSGLVDVTTSQSVNVSCTKYLDGTNYYLYARTDSGGWDLTIPLYTSTPTTVEETNTYFIYDKLDVDGTIYYNYAQPRQTGDGTSPVFSNGYSVQVNTQEKMATKYLYLYAYHNNSFYDVEVPLYTDMANPVVGANSIYSLETINEIQYYDLSKYKNGTATNFVLTPEEQYVPVYYTANDVDENGITETLYKMDSIACSKAGDLEYSTSLDQITSFTLSNTSYSAEATNAKLYAGGIAGYLNGGTISGAVQQGTVSATGKGKSAPLTAGAAQVTTGGTEKIKGKLEIYAGGVAGGACGGNIKDCLIQGMGSITLPGADDKDSSTGIASAKGYAGSCFGIVEDSSSVATTSLTTCIVDNGTSGKLTGTGIAEAVECLVNAETPDLVTGLAQLSLDKFNEYGDSMSGWKCLEKDETKENDDIYVPAWLVKNPEFTYSMDANGTFVTTLPEGESAFNKLTVHYLYHDQLEDDTLTEGCVTSGEKETIAAGLQPTMGKSGYMKVCSTYAADGKFYYFKQYDATDTNGNPILENCPTVYLDNKDYSQLTYGESFNYDEGTKQYLLEVQGDIPEEATVKYYYSFIEQGNVSSLSALTLPGSGGTEAEATWDENSSTNNRWTAKISYPDDKDGDAVFLGFWEIDGKYYPAATSDSIAAPPVEFYKETLQTGIYYQNTSDRNMVYTALETGADVFEKQSIQMLNCETNSSYSYYYLFSKDPMPDHLQQTVDQWKDTASAYGKGSSITVPSYEDDVTEIYLYLFKARQGRDTAVREYRFSLKEDGIEPSVSDDTAVLNGTWLSLDVTNFATGLENRQVRYLIRDSKMSEESLTGLETTVYTAGSKIQLLRGETNNKYIYVQAFGKVGDIDACSQVVEFSYVFSEKSEVPTISPNTISIMDGTENIQAASEVEAKTVAYLETQVNGKILYCMGNNFEGSQISATIVGNEAMVSRLNQSAGDNDSTTINNILYIRNNGIWYQMSAGAKVYDPESGIYLNNETNATVDYYIGVINFAEKQEDEQTGKEPSETVYYVYHVLPMTAAETPIAVLSTSETNPTTVLVGDSLYFNTLTADAEMYYTTNNSNPGIEEKGATKKYDPAEGIKVTGNYNNSFIVKIVAVKRNASGELMTNPSSIGYYIYRIIPPDQVEKPTSIPSTDETNPTKLSPGEKILLSTGTTGAAIYYTTDGSNPSVTLSSTEADATITVNNGTLYDATKGIVMPEQGDGYFTIRALAVKPGMLTSDVVELRYSFPDGVSSPYATPVSGTVELGTTVELKDATKGAVIYYEVAYGGNVPANPTLGSAVFDSAHPFVIDQDTTIKAMAVLDGVKSDVVTFSYVASAKLGVPEASLKSGSIVSRSTSLTLSAEGGSIYYTTDGSDPSDVTNTNAVSGNSLLLDGDYGSVITVKACTRMKGSSTSDVATFTYQISQYQGGVTSDVASGGELTTGTTVNLISDVSDAVIYYTVDGTSPTSGSSTGTTVTLNQSPGSLVTVKAVAVPKGLTVDDAGSTTAIFTYKMKQGIAAPTASHTGGTLSSAISVSLSAPQGNIYYTTDGTTPTANSSLYKEPITVNKTMTLKAIAITDTGDKSDVASFSYQAAGRAAQPRASLESKVVEPGTKVLLSCQTGGAQIYYSTDGTVPTLNNLDSLLKYDGEGIIVNRTVTIQAVAYKEGLLLSKVSSYTYEVDTVPAEEAKIEAEKEAAANALQETDATGLESRREESTEGVSIKGVILTEDEFCTCVAAAEDVFPENTKLVSRDAACSTTMEANLRALLGDEYEILQLYDMRLYSNGASVQPSGDVEIGIPVPKEYEDAVLTIIYVDGDGNVRTCETRRSGNMLYAYTNHFSVYGVAGVSQPDQRGFQLNVTVIVAGVAGIIAITGIGFIFVQRIRRRKYRRTKQ